MKKIFNSLLIAVIAVGLSSCKDYLDINENTNSSTESSPELVLPQAIVGTASVTQTYNSNFYNLAGFSANIYGVGGYGSAITYAYTATDFSGLFTSVYDNATDYQYIIDNTSEDPSLAYSTSIARIMKSFLFAKLVDQYNDVPYSEALKGADFLNPKYDSGVDVYKDLVAQLTLAINTIDEGQSGTVANSISSNSDPLFHGDMDHWKEFANTIKLRLLIKMAGVPELNAYARSEFAAINQEVGFLEIDALVNPGYVKEANRQNPLFNSLGFNTSGTRARGQAIPTTWIYSFYDGTKLEDPGRGSVIYRSYPNTATNQLGEENTTPDQIPPPNFTSWFTGETSTSPALGVAKGPSQGQPIMLAAESFQLQAEAYVRGYLSGDARSAFEDGIYASFEYLFKNQNDVVDGSIDVDDEVSEYFEINSASALVNFALAATNDQKLEAIITQKYIAMNVIHSDEAYNEFRRTSYPRIVNGSNNPTLTFASKVSVSTRPDELVGRILYPQREFNLNGANVPQGITLFGSRIFWDLN